MQFNGRKFAEIRKRKGISQGEVARRLGCAQPSVQAWEAGKSSPRQVDINQIAEALECEVSDLVDVYVTRPSNLGRQMISDPLLPRLLDAWIQLDIVEQAQAIKHLESVAHKKKPAPKTAPKTGKKSPSR